MQIIIGGFGRSGTTWLSDIVSKCLGGLILFEPFHPGVYDASDKVIYAGNIDDNSLRSHLDEIRASHPANPWILRNHLNSPIEKHSASFIKYVWSNSKILGYKTIRGNHCLYQLSQVNGDSKVVYIYRHPLAVLASINKRRRFWEEFGWEQHVKFFFARTLKSPQFSAQVVDYLRDITDQLRTKNEIIVAMWAISFMISLREVEKAGGHLVSYENLYKNPYELIRGLMRYLRAEENGMHPSYFFTPSMTSLKTLHHLQKYKGSELNLDEIFWVKEMKATEADQLKALCERILQSSERAVGLARQCNYL